MARHYFSFTNSNVVKCFGFVWVKLKDYCSLNSV